MRHKDGVGLAEVARRAGVSAATVSNFLNRPDSVKPSTKQKVMAAIEELDFVPNQAAAALRMGSSRLIGLVIPEVVNPFYAAIASAVADAGDRHRYAVSLCITHDDPVRELRQFDTLAEHRAAGALVVPLTADPSRLAQLRRVGARLILVDRAAGKEDGCSVAIDDAMGGRLAVKHLLLSRGPRIALVNGSTAIPQCADRRIGARQALVDAGLDPAGMIEREVDEMTIEAGRSAGRELGLSGGFTGIFCTNDQLAVGVIRGLSDVGVRTPADVSVVGYGDLALAADGVLSLTSVSQPKEDLGETAVLKLLSELSEGEAHQHSSTMLQPRLVIRQSAPNVNSKVA